MVSPGPEMRAWIVPTARPFVSTSGAPLSTGTVLTSTKRCFQIGSDPSRENFQQGVRALGGPGDELSVHPVIDPIRAQGAFPSRSCRADRLLVGSPRLLCYYSVHGDRRSCRATAEPQSLPPTSPKG